MIKKIDVFADKIIVGTIALTKEKQVAFQYSKEWLKKDSQSILLNFL